MTRLNTEIEKLEEILRKNPDAPEFARLASLYIDTGRYGRALDLCERGIPVFPEYAMGYLMAAIALKCLKRYGESAAYFQRVNDILPRSVFTRAEIQELNELIQRENSAGEKEKSTVELLAEKLKDYKPKRTKGEQYTENKFIPEETEDDGLPIVSETLANIFFQQKQYDRAIEAYGRLIKENPDKTVLYLTRIEEIEEVRASSR